MRIKKIISAAIVCLMYVQLHAVNLSDQRVVALAAQSSNKLIVLSSDATRGFAGYTLLRLNSNGTIDTSFASQGFYAFADGITVAPNLIITASDQIIVGYNYQANAYMQLFSASGSAGTPVQIFDNAAIQTLSLYTSGPHAGKIAVAGGVGIGGIAQGFVARYDSSFVIDPTFNGGVPQYLQLDFQTEVQVSQIDASGNVVVAGQTNYNAAFMARYDADGVLDSGFGTSGIQTISAFQIRAIAFDSASRILICGSNAGQAFIQRLSSSGSVDGSFTPSINISPTFNTPTEFTGISVAASDSVLVSGSAVKGGVGQLVTVKYTSAGALDTGFNTVGWAITVSPFTIASQGLLMLGSGAMIHFGSDVLGSLLAQYLSSGSLDTAFCQTGYVYFAADPLLGVYIQAYRTITYNVPGVFSTFSFNAIGQNSCWTFSPGDTVFVVPVTGRYLANVDMLGAATTTNSSNLSMVAYVNSVQLPNSQSSVLIRSGERNILSQSFIAQLNAGDVLEIRITADAASRIALYPNGQGTTKIPANISITKIN